MGKIWDPEFNILKYFDRYQLFMKKIKEMVSSYWFLFQWELVNKFQIGYDLG
jgi:hypothetical protein